MVVLSYVAVPDTGLPPVVSEKEDAGVPPSASLNVAVTLLVIGMFVAFGVGLVDATCGAVLSFI